VGCAESISAIYTYSDIFYTPVKLSTVLTKGFKWGCKVLMCCVGYATFAEMIIISNDASHATVF